MENHRHNSIKTRTIEREGDIDSLIFGDVVGVEEKGLMRYHDKVDRLYLFFGRKGKGVVEVWFTREQLELGRCGFLRTKKYYDKKYYQSNAADQDQRDLFSYINEKLGESGL